MTSTGTQGQLQIALLAGDGKYVTVDAASPWLLRAGRDAAGPGSGFEMFPQDDLTLALKAANGRFVSVPGDGSATVAAGSEAIGKTEVFTIQPMDDVRVALLASNGKYLSCAAGVGMPLRADHDQPGSTEIFSIEHVSGPARPAPAPAADFAEPVARDAQPAAAAATTTTATTTGVAAAATAVAAAGGKACTVFLCGTACTRDEGEVSRSDSDKAIYAPRTGYIPVRLHLEISGSLTATAPSATVRGVGVNDWAANNNSEPLLLDGPLKADSTLLDYARPYSGGNQYSQSNQIDGWPLPALALHAANLAARSGAGTINFVGHSRGAVEAIMAAWFLYAYGGPTYSHIPVNIFAIDPVPGTGDWYSIITQLAPNVASYVGVYAWDMCLAADKPFQAVVPRPNGRMLGQPNEVKLPSWWWWPWNNWKHLAYESQRQDPLQPAGNAQPSGYELYACRGRHGTVAGIATADGKYDPRRVSEEVKPVPELVYRMARGYLTRWGVDFQRDSAVTETALSLRRRLNTDHRVFDAMGGGATRTFAAPLRPYVRRVSSIMGSNPLENYYLDNVAGDPPYTMAYPVTNERSDAGWVKWLFL